MNRVSITLGIISLAATIAFIFGCWLQWKYPAGIWLYTPPADGAGMPGDALYIDAALGGLVIAAIYLIGAICLIFWVKLKARSLPIAFLPLVASALIIFALVAALSAAGS